MFSIVKKKKRPSLFWLITEPSRAITELGLGYSYNTLVKAKADGDGHAVMIIPGFMGSDSSTKVLRNFLEDRGYTIYDWGLGRNVGRIEDLLVLVERVEAIYKQTGQPVSLIGWSLGGIYARQLAKQKPQLIRQVITLGSPFRNLTKPNNLEWFYSLITLGKTSKDTHHALLNDFPRPAPVPTTAIYTKEDGIVHWDTCLEDEDDLHQNIQVRGSHCGLGVNPTVFSVVADRLRYHKGNWQHFKPNGVLDSLLFYPSL